MEVCLCDGPTVRATEIRAELSTAKIASYTSAPPRIQSSLLSYLVSFYSSLLFRASLMYRASYLPLSLGTRVRFNFSYALTSVQREFFLPFNSKKKNTFNRSDNDSISYGESKFKNLLFLVALSNSQIEKPK